MQKPLYEILPGLINSIPVRDTAERLSDGKPLASLEMLRVIMAQLRQIDVGGNYAPIEKACLDKARTLDTIHKPEVPTEKLRWFRVGLAGLRRAKRKHRLDKKAAAAEASGPMYGRM